MDEADSRRLIIDGLRRYGTDAARLGNAFAALHQLQPVDVQALVAILSAAEHGAALTPTGLRRHLGLSSGGTSLVIDRLERSGHIRRDRDHPTDSRVVHLRQTDHGMAIGLDFFRPVSDRTHAVMDQFTATELQTIARFLSAIADTLHTHIVGLETAAGSPGDPTKTPTR